jgi:hypothetical protein
MKVRSISVISGIERTLDIDVTIEQLFEWQKGKVSQLAMPNLTPSEREFLKTGIVDEEWEELHSNE